MQTRTKRSPLFRLAGILAACALGISALPLRELPAIQAEAAEGTPVAVGAVYQVGEDINFNGASLFYQDDQKRLSYLNGDYQLTYRRYETASGQYYFDLLGKQGDSYGFYITSANHGDPWGVCVSGGDGTYDAPYQFRVLFDDPENQATGQLSGVYLLNYEMDFGSGVYCVTDDDSDRVSLESGSGLLKWDFYRSKSGQYVLRAGMVPLYLTAEYNNRPKGIRVTRGDGTEDNPYHFAVIFDPPELDPNVLSGQFRLGDPIDFGEGAYFVTDDQVNYTAQIAGSMDLTAEGYDHRYGQYAFRLNDTQFWITAPDEGDAWGITVVSGSGTESDPYRFGVLTDDPAEMYDLFICGTQVTNLNRKDILGNGVFSYDAARNTLTVSGDYSFDPENGTTCLIDSTVPDLTIQIAADSALTSQSQYGIAVCSNTVITGSGKLRISTPGNECIYVSSAFNPDGTTLTIQNIDMELSGTAALIGRTGHEALVIEKAYVTASSSEAPAVSSFTNGITLNDSAVFSPEKAQIINGTVCNADGSAAESVRIEKLKYYPVNIKSNHVHNANCDDILGDGVFSYDPEANVLTISGDCTDESFIPIWSNIPGLTLYVASDSVVTGNQWAAIVAVRDMVITGSGKLTVNGGKTIAISVPSDYPGTVLTVKDVTLELTGAAGLRGDIDQNTHLVIDNAEIRANSTGRYGAIEMFSSITLKNCAVISPAGAVISDGMVCNPDGTAAKEVVISAQKPLTSANVTLSQNAFAYTGSAIKCGSYITVKDGDTALKYGTDFTMSYANNTEVGYQTATVTITGTGKYSGTVTKKFSILPKKQTAPKLTVLNSEGGIHVEWTADTTCEGFQIEYCQNAKFTGDTLHTVSVAADKTSCILSTYPKPGETWYLRVRAYLKDADGTKRGYWSPATAFKVTGTINSVTLSQNAFAFTGSAIKCGSCITVKSGETTLKYGTDFTMSYANNTEVGYQTATVTITGTGNYTGTVTKKFSILPKKQAAPTLSILSNAGGIHVEWKADTTCEGFQLEYCQDYTFTGDTFHSVSLSASRTAADLAKYPKPGETWYVRIRAFIKDASGTKRGYRSPIASIKVTGYIDSVTLSKTKFNYTGSAVKCGNYITVKAGDTTLKYGTDFTVSYENNTNVGYQTATVTIKGIGNYAGSVTKSFTIMPKQQAAPTVTAVSGGFRVSWTKDTNAVGYEVCYCKDAYFIGETLHTVTYTGTSATLTKYPSTGETWYVKVRAFITKDGTTSGTKYGTYSTAVSVKAG